MKYFECESFLVVLLREYNVSIRRSTVVFNRRAGYYPLLPWSAVGSVKSGLQTAALPEFQLLHLSDVCRWNQVNRLRAFSGK